MNTSRSPRLVLSAAILFGMIFTQGTAKAQQFDLGFGVSTVTAPSASSATGNYSNQSVGGGAYPAFSGDVLLKHNFGISGELAWRASQALYQGYQPFRPIFWDFNGIWIPTLTKNVSAELMGGIGAETTRFYTNYYNCSFFGGCTPYVSSNHFMGHFGGGIRLYVHGNFFVRPEAHVYLVRNNFEFSSAESTRYGVSIGYTFGGRR
jgi:hypothetical protein